MVSYSWLIQPKGQWWDSSWLMLPVVHFRRPGRGKKLKLGQGVPLAKVDIEHAYRNIPLHPNDRILFAMRWKEKLYVDTVLPFGLCSAPKIFFSSRRHRRMDCPWAGCASSLALPRPWGEWTLKSARTIKKILCQCVHFWASPSEQKRSKGRYRY